MYIPSCKKKNIPTFLIARLVQKGKKSTSGSIFGMNLRYPLCNFIEIVLNSLNKQFRVTDSYETLIHKKNKLTRCFKYV